MQLATENNILLNLKQFLYTVDVLLCKILS